MPNRTIAVHTSEDNIEQLSTLAEALRRSRNSLINEAIEMILEHYDTHAVPAHNSKRKTGK